MSQMGHTRYHYLPQDMFLRDGRLFARLSKLEVRRELDNHFSLGAAEIVDLASMDVVLVALFAFVVLRGFLRLQHEEDLFRLLAAAGRVDESLPLFKKAFDMRPLWRELVQRLPASGLLPDDPELMERILSVE